MIDYEGLILARQDYQEIYEDEPDSPIFDDFSEEELEEIYGQLYIEEIC